MTKAERIFVDTRRDCKTHIQNWGYATNPDGSAVGFNRVSCRDDECVSSRTLYEMNKLLKRMRKDADFCKRRGIFDQTWYESEMQIYNMIESTIKNTRKATA